MAARDEAPEPVVDDQPIRRPSVTLAACASAAAGLVHAAAAGAHSGDDTLVGLFAAVAVAQLAFAGGALLRPTRPVLGAGVVLNAGAVAVWALSRTTGLPLIDSLRVAEDVGRQDLICAVLGTVAALAALVAVLDPRPREHPERMHAALLTGTAALVLAVPAMTAGHAHRGTEVAAGGHDHGEIATASVASPTGAATVAAAAPVAAAGHAHPETAAEAAVAATVAPPAVTGPVISVDDPRVTPEQRAGAQALMAGTSAALAPLADEAGVVAAGYRSIGDAATGFEHFVHWGYLTDGVSLDPSRVESIVFTVAADGTKQMASGMYILPPGQTMADVPDIAGELTTWHDHQDLCWKGDQVVGHADNGVCTAGTLIPTPPMLHVWMVDHPCGPFAGIEGHGGACASHTHHD